MSPHAFHIARSSYEKTPTIRVVMFLSECTLLDVFCHVFNKTTRYGVAGILYFNIGNIVYEIIVRSNANS